MAESEHDPPGPALPFQSPSAEQRPPREGALPQHLTALDVAQYAALCAELAARPQAVAEILSRHGIADDTERAALDALWRKRMAFDPRLEQSWRWHVARHGSLGPPPRR